MQCFSFIYHDDVPYHELIVSSSTMDSTTTTQYPSVPTSSNYGEFAFCGTFDNNAIHFLGSSSLGAPVYIDLSNNNVIVTNNSLYSTLAFVKVLSNLISQYMTTSTTKTSSNEQKNRLIVTVDKVLLVRKF